MEESDQVEELFDTKNAPELPLSSTVGKNPGTTPDEELNEDPEPDVDKFASMKDGVKENCSEEESYQVGTVYELEHETTEETVLKAVADANRDPAKKVNSGDAEETFDHIENTQLMKECSAASDDFLDKKQKPHGDSIPKEEPPPEDDKQDEAEAGGKFIFDAPIKNALEIMKPLEKCEISSPFKEDPIKEHIDSKVSATKPLKNLEKIVKPDVQRDQEREPAKQEHLDGNDDEETPENDKKLLEKTEDPKQFTEEISLMNELEDWRTFEGHS